MIKKLRRKLQPFSDFKITIFLFLPLLLANITYSTSSFCASVMIAHLGNEALAAYALSYTTFFSLFSFFYGLLISISILVAEAYGKQNHSKIQLTLNQAALLTVFCSIPFFCIVWYVPALFPLISQNIVVIKLATKCLRSLAWSILPLLLLISIEQFLIGLSLAKIVLWISIIKFPIEVFLNYVFVFGKYGFPAFGVEGIGYGFTLTFTLADIAIIVFLFSTQHNRKYLSWPSKLKLYSPYLKELIKLGLPIALTYSIETLIFFCTTLLMAKFGTSVLVSQQITKQYAELTIIVASALSQAVTVRIGQLGRDNLHSVRKLVNSSMTVGVAVMLLIAVVYTFFPKFIISLDMDINDPKNSEVLKITTQLFFLTGIFQIFDCMRLIAIGALRGLKDTTTPLYISLFTFWIIGFPLSCILGFIFNFQGKGVIYGLLLGVITGSIFLTLRLRKVLNELKE